MVAQLRESNSNLEINPESRHIRNFKTKKFNNAIGTIEEDPREENSSMTRSLFNSGWSLPPKHNILISRGNSYFDNDVSLDDKSGESIL